MNITKDQAEIITMSVQNTLDHLGSICEAAKTGSIAQVGHKFADQIDKLILQQKAIIAVLDQVVDDHIQKNNL